MIVLTGQDLTINAFIRVVKHHEQVSLSEHSIENVNRASDFVASVVEEEKPVYGINTGFGKLSDVPINKCDVAQLQKNLLMSHACGVGKPFNKEIVRGMMLLRVNALIKGYSGIRLETLEKLLELLNKDVTPVVFEKGSLGASGDLAPLSHMSLPLIGLGEVFYKDQRLTSKEGLKRAGVTPLKALYAKEGLSLINGTQAMTSVGAMAVYEAEMLLKYANLSVASTMEALRAILDAFDPRIHALRGHLGQINVAKEIREHLEGSTYVSMQGELRTQDAYSIRCTPQVHGAVYDAIHFVKEKVEIEMNAVTDNPIIFIDDALALSAGNFHGEPMAIPFDYLGIAMSELANISERRIERMVNPQLNEGLPAFLVKNPGLNSGFMIAQYSAASLVSENKVLSHPASVDSIPSSANQEDHVSMGTIGARKALEIIRNARKVVSIEFMTAMQAIDLRGSHELGKQTKKVYDKVRRHIPLIEDDTVMYHHIHKMDDLLKQESFLKDLLEVE